MFRSPVSKCVSMAPLAKATDESPVARGLSTRALLSETPSPLRFGIAHPGRLHSVHVGSGALGVRNHNRPHADFSALSV